MANLCLPDLNEVRIAGRLTRDPELKYLPSGTAVCEFGIAQSRKWKDKSGEQREEKFFGSVTCWNKTAEYVSNHLGKGVAVLVSGRLALEEWTGKDGDKKQKTRIVADRVQRMEWSDDGERRAPAPTQTQRAEPEHAQAESLPFPDEDDIPF